MITFPPTFPIHHTVALNQLYPAHPLEAGDPQAREGQLNLSPKLGGERAAIADRVGVENILGPLESPLERRSMSFAIGGLGEIPA
jgi:hypothetical protein